MDGYRMKMRMQASEKMIERKKRVRKREIETGSEK